MRIDKYCTYCKETFSTSRKKQNQCSPQCRERARILECNKRWCEREPRTPTKESRAAMEKFKLATLYPRQNSGYLRKYSAVRG